MIGMLYVGIGRAEVKVKTAYDAIGISDILNMTLYGNTVPLKFWI